MSWLSEWLHPQRGAQQDIQAVMPYYRRAQETERRYLDPFITRGQQAGDILSGQYGRLAQDPGAVLSEMMGGYQQSPYSQMMQQRLSQATANTAAAGGMRGAPAEQTRQQELTQALLSKDMQQYLQNVMGLRGQGLAGEQSLYGIGAGAAGGLGSDLANILSTMGSLEFQGRRQGRQAQSDLMSGLLGLGGSLFGGLF